jgi:hypothetical protein
VLNTVKQHSWLKKGQSDVKRGQKDLILLAALHRGKSGTAATPSDWSHLWQYPGKFILKTNVIRTLMSAESARFSACDRSRRFDPRFPASPPTKRFRRLAQLFLARMLTVCKFMLYARAPGHVWL